MKSERLLTSERLLAVVLASVLASAIGLVIGGCGGQVSESDPGVAVVARDGTTNDKSNADLDGTLIVFAAASLTDGFAAMADAFEADHPNVEIQLNLAGSATLREQILEGAPADVFAPADQANMRSISQNGEVVGSPRIFARNRMQIAVPAGNPGAITGLGDFAAEDLLLGLCAEGVPCGDLARLVLSSAGVEPSVDTNESDVRALLTKIGADELDGGIVYATDVAALEPNVEGVDVPAADNVTTDYPIAVVAGGFNRPVAEAFVNFVVSVEGRSVLAEFGFDTP